MIDATCILCGRFGELKIYTDPKLATDGKFRGVCVQCYGRWSMYDVFEEGVKARAAIIRELEVKLSEMTNDRNSHFGLRELETHECLVDKYRLELKNANARIGQLESEREVLHRYLTTPDQTKMIAAYEELCRLHDIEPDDPEDARSRWGMDEVELK